MPRKPQITGIIIHLPQDGCAAAQDAVNEFYARAVEGRLRRAGLTPKETEYILKDIIDRLGKNT